MEKRSKAYQPVVSQPPANGLLTTRHVNEAIPDQLNQQLNTDTRGSSAKVSLDNGD